MNYSQFQIVNFISKISEHSFIIYTFKKKMRTRDIDKEKSVITNAITMFVQDGFQGFSMNKLAKKCNISVATLYIYYEHKDDLIKKIGVDIGRKFFDTMVRDFSAELPFSKGLWQQWENRAAFAISFPQEVAFFEAARHSPHGEYIMQSSQLANFKEIMSGFFENAIRNKELIPLPLEVFWSIAYGPLYALLRFHSEGKSIGGRPFTFSKEMMAESFEVVLKALTPNSDTHENLA